MALNGTGEVDSESGGWNSHDHPIWYLSSTGLPLGVLAVWTAMGNLLVLIAMGRYRSLRTITNYLICNMAASDLLLAVTVLPFSIVNDLLDFWVFGEAFCRVWLALDVLYSTASIWNIVAVAFDRFTATSFPLWYRRRRSHVVAVSYIGTVWSLSALISIAPMLTSEQLERTYVPTPSGRHYCVLYSQASYVVLSSVGSFVLPMFVLVVLYSRIFVVLHAQSKLLAESGSSSGMAVCTKTCGSQKSKWQCDRAETMTEADTNLEPTSESAYSARQSQLVARLNDSGSVESAVEAKGAKGNLKPAATAAAKTRRRRNSLRRFARREKEATKRVTVVVAVFLVCWVPFMVMYLYRGLTGHDVNEHLQKFVTWLGYVNSALNPCLYIWQNKDFRKAFLKIQLSCSRSCRKLLCPS